MKRKAAALLAVLMLAGCGNKLYEESMSQGKLALAAGEFDKARASFELALEEEPGDTDASVMYEQLKKFGEIESALEKAEWEEAEKQADILLKNKDLHSSLKEPLAQYKQSAADGKEQEQAVAEKVKSIQSLTSEKKYSEAKSQLDEMNDDDTLKMAAASFSDELDEVEKEIQAGLEREAEAEKAAAVQQAEEAAARKAEEAAAAKVNQKTEYYQKLDRIERSQADLAYIYENGTTVEMREAETERYKRWDDALNEIYGVLKEQLPASEMDQLRQAQREWITYRDETAEETASGFAGGSWESVQYVSTQASITQERCYELVDRYMD